MPRRTATVRRGACCRLPSYTSENTAAVFGGARGGARWRINGNGCDFLDDMLQYKHKFCLTTYQATEKPDDRGKGESAQ